MQTVPVQHSRARILESHAPLYKVRPDPEIPSWQIHPEESPTHTCTSSRDRNSTRRKAVSVILVAEITPADVLPESAVRLDVDPAHQFVIGKTGVLGSYLVAGSKPNNWMVVAVFVDSLHPDFLFPEVDGLVMECVRIKFQIGRSQGKLAGLENDPIFGDTGEVVQVVR